MSLSSLNAELNRLIKEQKELSIYKDKIQGLGKVLDGINTLDIALKINEYYKIDDTSTDKIATIKESISDLGSSLIGDSKISSAIAVKNKEISAKKAEIAQEEARIAEEEARRKEEEARRQAEESARQNASNAWTESNLKW